MKDPDPNTVWRSKSDQELLEAASALGEYTTEAQAAIRSELAKRDLAPKEGGGLKEGPQGLGGWLILVGIGVVVSPLRILGQLLVVYVPIFTEGVWETLTTPGGGAYHPLWQPILIGEMVVNVLLLLASLYLALLFFSKKKSFPRWFIGIMLFYPLFLLADAFAIKLVLPNAQIFDEESSIQLAGAIIAAAIWVPYMLISKRVKATFVK